MRELSPEEIKRIRESLGLSQVEAGKLLGGGPSAFAKYEKGSIRPSACLVKMLKFLRSKPEELEALTTGRVNAAGKAGTTPFEVASEDISRLKAPEFSTLVGKLMSAEAQESGIPSDGIHVSYETSAPDGGEDARIEWQGGLARTSFLPNRFCQFQLKTGKISPKRAGEEVLNSNKKQLKEMIRPALEKGGSYIMLCSSDYSKKAIQDRESNILKNIRKHLPETKETQVQFRDSGQIAAWVAGRPPVAMWLLKNIHSPLANPSFGGWDHWSRRAEHSGSPWVKDPRLSVFREKLLSIVQTPKGAAKVVGPYGAGKSRLALEAFRPTQEESTSGVRLSDLVLYVVESEAGSSEINKLAWELVNSKRRSVLVVDCCSEETRTDLEGIVRHSDSRTSLVTINDEVPRHAEKSEDTLVVGRAEHSFIEKVVRSVDPSISELLDRRRIADFSDGNILCARVISESWNKTGLAASAGDEMLVKKFIGGGSSESDHLYKAAMLISAFGEVSVKPHGDHLVQLAAELRGGISVKDFHDAITKLKRRGVVSRYGDSAILRPELIAIKLAELQWESWYEILDEAFPEELIKKTANQLAMINTTEIAAKVARKICENRKLWFSPEKWKGNLEILVSLAQIDARRVVDLLENIISPLTQTEINNMGHERDNIVRALSIITSLDSDAFEKAALLLFRFAVEETRPRGHATDQFKSLFPAKHSRTAAGSEKRLKVIDKLREEAKSIIDEHRADARLSVITDSLFEGAKPAGFSVEPGPKIHGSRPALKPWWPETRQEYLDYVRGCAEGLAELAKRNDNTGARARTGLARNWHPYVLDGLIEDVERWTQEVTATHPYWPEALNSLEQFLLYSSNKLSPSTEKRVAALVSMLEPESLGDRIRFLVTEMPGRYLGREDMDIETRERLQRNEIKKLVGDLFAGGKDKLVKFIPQLSRGEQRRAFQFGLFLAEKTEDPPYWKKLIMKEFESAPEAERSHKLLVGYLAGIKDKDPKEFEKFKREAAESPVFAPVLLALTACTGISSKDVAAAIKALETDFIEPVVMNFWCGTAFFTQLRPSEVAPLFGFMLEKKEPGFFEVALSLMEMYMHDKEERLDELAPQFLLAAEYPSVAKDWDSESLYHYESLMERFISRGSDDSEARKAAIVIAKQLVDENLEYNGVEIIRQVLPALLSNLGEIAWPLISKALEEMPDKWRLSYALRDKPSYGDGGPPVLSLPENLLFGWCHANPEFAPAFVAEAVPILREDGQAEIHPVPKRLLDEFGERGDVLDGLESNIPGSVWHGSLADALAPYREPLMRIRKHEKEPVRQWADEMLEKIGSQIENIRRKEKESGFGGL